MENRPGILEGRLPGHDTGSTADDVPVAAEINEADSEAFHVPVEDVLNGALHQNYSSVVVIGLNGYGELEIAGSHGTPMILDMAARVPARIEEISRMKGMTKGEQDEDQQS